MRKREVIFARALIFVPILLAFLIGAAMAQDPPEDEAPAAAQEQTDAGDARPQGTPRQKDPVPDAAVKREKSGTQVPEEFTPTEELAEDLSIAFPVDM